MAPRRTWRISPTRLRATERPSFFTHPGREGASDRQIFDVWTTVEMWIARGGVEPAPRPGAPGLCEERGRGKNDHTSERVSSLGILALQVTKSSLDAAIPSRRRGVPFLLSCPSLGRQARPIGGLVHDAVRGRGRRRRRGQRTAPAVPIELVRGAVRFRPVVPSAAAQRHEEHRSHQPALVNRIHPPAASYPAPPTPHLRRSPKRGSYTSLPIRIWTAGTKAFAVRAQAVSPKYVKP